MTSQIQHKRNERTEAKFLEDAAKMIADAERLGSQYQPPNEMASVTNLKAKRDAALAARSANQPNEATEEQTRKTRQNLYKPLNKDVTSLIGYARSAGKAIYENAALQTANTSVINTEAATNTSSETLHKLAYLDADSLLNACISAKAYLRSRYGASEQPYKSIAKTRFSMPSCLRKK